jgi:hypothetical protein
VQGLMVVGWRIGWFSSTLLMEDGRSEARRAWDVPGRRATVRCAPSSLAGALIGSSKLYCDGVRRVFGARFSSLSPLFVASAASKDWRRSSERSALCPFRDLFVFSLIFGVLLLLSRVRCPFWFVLVSAACVVPGLVY